MGLPFFQSDLTLVPKKYCFTIAASVSAFQTFAAGAFTVNDVLKLWELIIELVIE
jgi:hypothetical protein